MKTVLVTGGAGFIGSHVVDALIARGDHCIVVDDLSTGRIENVNRGARLIETSIGHPRIFDLLMARPDCVLHFAGQSSVPRSVKDPFLDMQLNVGWTVNLLEACCGYAPHFVFASSSAVYGNVPSGSATETHPLHPISPYGISKLACEVYVEYFSTTYQMPATILRFGNVYGPRQRPEAGVVAAFCDRMQRNETMTIYGDGTAVRDYLYVDDAVSAVLAAMDTTDRRSNNCECFNVGSWSGTSLNELVAEMTWFNAIGNRLAHRTSARMGDVQRIVLNCDSANMDLGWNPFVNLKEGVFRTVVWNVARQREPQSA